MNCFSLVRLSTSDSTIRDYTGSRLVLLSGDERKMSVSGLKAELKFLESIFDTNHERFRIIDWKPDELSCQFNVTGDKLLIIHCNITVRYSGLACKRKVGLHPKLLPTLCLGALEYRWK